MSSQHLRDEVADMAGAQPVETDRSWMPQVADIAERVIAEREQPLEMLDMSTVTVTLTTTVAFRDVDYTVSKKALEDVELLEMMEDEKYISVIRSIVGLKQWAQFKEQVREDGKVPTTALEEFIKVVMGSLDPTSAS